MKHILAFGDSNTFGLIPGSRTYERYPWNVRWTGILDNENEDIHIIEEGLCGRTFTFDDAVRPNRKGVEALPMVLETHQPLDGAIIMLGTNDCKIMYRASEFVIGKALESLLDILQKWLPAEKILVISPLHLGDEIYLPEKDPEFDSESVKLSYKLKPVYKEIAEKRGIGFLAASDYVAAHPADDEHMDAAGHRKLADAILNKLKELGII